MNKFKANPKYLILGLFLPIIGIILANMLFDERDQRSLKKGSAITSLLLVVIASFLIIYYVGTKL